MSYSAGQGNCMLNHILGGRENRNMLWATELHTVNGELNKCLLNHTRCLHLADNCTMFTVLPPFTFEEEKLFKPHHLHVTDFLLMLLWKPTISFHCHISPHMYIKLEMETQVDLQIYIKTYYKFLHADQAFVILVSVGNNSIRFSLCDSLV